MAILIPGSRNLLILVLENSKIKEKCKIFQFLLSYQLTILENILQKNLYFKMLIKILIFVLFLEN